MLRKRLPYWGSADTLRRMDLDPYVIDVLMPDLVGHDRHPSAFLVYLFLDARCGGTTAELTLRQIAEGTGLSKRSVQAALRRLKARGLLSVTRASITAAGRYTVHRPWQRSRALRGGSPDG